MEKEKNFLSKIKSFKDFNMPRWDDLPEIDLYMDQVISVTDKLLSSLSVEDTPILTPSMINNYVKNRIIPPPVKKKYGREHLAKLIIICIMKPIMEISAIADIMTRNEALFGTAQMLDKFSSMFEKNIASRARSSELAMESTEKTEEMLCAIAIENAVKAGAEKVIAEHAYAEIRKIEKTTEETVKNEEKTKEKAKEKTPAKAEEKTKDKQKNKSDANPEETEQ